MVKTAFMVLDEKSKDVHQRMNFLEMSDAIGSQSDLVNTVWLVSTAFETVSFQGLFASSYQVRHSMSSAASRDNDALVFIRITVFGNELQ